MAVEIPGPPEGEVDFEVRVPLDGTFFTFRQRYNERVGSWVLDILTGDGDVLAQGLTMRADTAVNAHLRTRPGMPTGVLLPLDTTNAGTDPGLAEMGQRVRLVYITAEELAAEGLS